MNGNRLPLAPPARHAYAMPRLAGACQRGFSIVSAIFLLVVLGVLGAAIVRFSGTQSITSAQDVQGSRAYHAARAGLEWGIYQVLAPDSAPPAPDSAAWPGMQACPVAVLAPIEGFAVTLTCERFPAGAVTGSGAPVYNESGDVRSIIVYQLTAKSSSGTVGTVNYVERQISATVSNCRAKDGDPVFRYACP